MPNTKRNYDHPILSYGNTAVLSRWSGIHSPATIAEYLRRPRSKMPKQFRVHMARLTGKSEEQLFRERKA